MKNNPFLAVFNFRLLFICFLTTGIFFGSKYFDLTYKNDYNIFSIAVVFPLVFSLTAAYRKRQAALSHFSSIRANLVCVYDYFKSGGQISPAVLGDLKKELVLISENLIQCISQANDEEKIVALRKQLELLTQATTAQRMHLNEREIAYIIRAKKDLSFDIETLYSLKHHNSPRSLRAYCLVFIYLFPFIYVPGIVQNISYDSIAYEGFFLFLALLIGFVLMALYNIQELIEDPFDNEGLDDVKLDLYKMDVSDLTD